jgi:hypothetical protein
MFANEVETRPSKRATSRQREERTMVDEREESREHVHEGAESCGHRGDRHRHRDGGRSRGRGSRHRRKERVLHTRISEQLSDDIRRLADDMRVPVSNLVRNVLEEVFTVVDSVSEDVGDFFEEVLDEAESVRERIRNRQEGRQRGARSQQPRGRRSARSQDVEEELRRDEATESKSEARSSQEEPQKAFPDVLGWQPIVVNRELDCASCEISLTRGDRAFLGIASAADAPVVLCAECVQAR